RTSKAVVPVQRVHTVSGGYASAGVQKAAVVRPFQEPNSYYRDLSYHYITIRPGDTLSKVADENHLPLSSLIAMNGLHKPYVIYPGQQLKIPAFHQHVVRPGETLYAISRVYDLDMAEVAHFNFLSPPYTLSPGERLQIPLKSNGEVRVASASTTDWSVPQVQKAAVAKVTSEPLDAVSVNTLPPLGAAPKALVANTASVPDKDGGPAAAQAGQGYQVAKAEIPPVPRHKFTIKTPPVRASEAFSWPVKGKIISGFGKKSNGLHNDGVNILVKEGTPIRASENGVVSYVGNEMRSFGNLLLISHSDGYVTAYGHTEKALVAKGDAVKKGEIIAYAGSSGNVTESQLHFEIRKKGRAIDPVALLE
ncbi:MAG: LysM peptidoglycan-binding domain-containing protein, partial [Alphaproteobacteria bacterium]